MQNIFPTINYKYPLPLNYDANNPEFDIFKNITDENCFAPEINILENVRISSNSIVFNYFRIFKDSCIKRKNFQKYQRSFRFFIKFIFPQLNFSKKRFLLITDEWSNNYYHWHIFALKKLAILQESNLIKDSLLFLPKKYKSYKFVLASLEKFGITKDQVVFLRKKSNIKVKELPLIKAPRQHPEIFKKLRTTLTKVSNQKDLGFGDKIYISREGQALRFVENEQELVNLIEKYGFKKVVMENLSYDEQIAICSKAKYLISPHGAGLTNILFMSQGSYVLEMASPRKKLNNDYYAISSMLDINYLYQACKIGENSRAKDFHQGSLVVDLAKLENNLKLMLNK